jgi:hypothetical protein
MKRLLFPVLMFFILVSMIPSDNSGYNPNYVEISTVKHQNNDYNVVFLTRRDNHIKAKYFGAKDYDGSAVPFRYTRWKQGRDIICLTSAGYMDNMGVPVGLTIDNGVVVNQTLEDFDGLIIVYATGGVVATNLENGDLNIPGIGNLDIKNSYYDKQTFLKWASDNQATVFQTHLFVYKNQLLPDIDNKVVRERRFLAVGILGSETVHAIVNSPLQTTLRDGASRTLKFLNEYKGMNVIFMINLDPGAQNVFFLYDEFGNESDVIKGTLPVEHAANLLVYYYE